MTRQSLFWHTKGLFYRIWIAICCLIMIATVASSLLVYVQISSQLQVHMKQRLIWEANYYRQQLEEAFLQAALKLDGLVRSAAAIRADRPLLQNEMDGIRLQSPSVIRSWVAYPDGILIPSAYTRLDYVQNLPWWREYLTGHTPESFMGYLMSRSQSLVGKPYINQAQLTTIVPLVSLGLRGTKIIRAAGAEVELNNMITDLAGVNNDWSTIPVSIYTMEGRLVASPYRYHERLTMLNQDSRHPLIVQMRQNPNDINGFLVYDYQRRKMAGVFLKIPTLGLVLTVEYRAAEVVDPVRRIASGPLIVAALLVLVATVLIVTIYSNTKRLRRMEYLARGAELRALQACINPHFLFNTLNCLVGMAVSTGNEVLVKMIRSLISIFGYTVRNMNELITLRAELDYLREYIWIQQVRFGQRFSFQLSVADEWLDAKIFKFCLQPLVENCFVHGVEKSLDPIVIEVNVIRREADLLITVSDNGPGLTAERFAEIIKSLATDSYELGSGGNGVGLSNIHHRLRYAFGPEYGIEIKLLSKGLAVILKLPYVERGGAIFTRNFAIIPEPESH